MTIVFRPGERALAAKLASLTPLRPEDIDALVAVGRQTCRTVRASYGSPLRLEAGIIIVEGWAARARQLTQGRRQLTELLIPGDVILPGRAHNSDLFMIALSDLVTVNAGPLLRMISDDGGWPRIRFACMLAEAETDYWLTEHVARLGRQTAVERLASLLQETHYRLARIGLADGPSFAWPLVQEQLGDLLGISTVHVNRTLKVLRAAGAITSSTRQAIVVNLEKLRDLCRFDPPVLERISAPGRVAHDLNSEPASRADA